MTFLPYATVPAYRTKEGSEISKLMRPNVHGSAAQSLAEATAPAGTRTTLHRHCRQKAPNSRVFMVDLRTPSVGRVLTVMP